AVSVSQAGIHTAQADVTRSSAAIEQAHADVAHAEQGVSRAKAESTYASNNFHRLEPLLTKQFVTVDQVDRARTYEIAQAEALKQAESQLLLSQAELKSALALYERSGAALDESKAQHEQSRNAVTTLEPLINQRGARTSAVKDAHYNLDNCRVYAPFDARVTNLTISEGAYAHVGEQIFTLIDARTWWAIGNFREGLLSHIKPGMRADVYVLSKPSVRFSGVVDSVGFGVTPDPDRIGRLGPGLPQVERSLNWVHGIALPGSRARRGSRARSVSDRRVSCGHDSRKLKMATVIQSLPQSFAPLTWVRQFLKEELAPYPGRAAVVGRMTIAATLIMIVCMTFRIQFACQGAIYALLISRESPRATLRSAAVIAIVTVISAAYLLFSVGFVISNPELHLLWVITSFFLVFYAISAVRDYTAAVIFAIMIAVVIPLWDRHVPAETNVEDTLWLCLAVMVGVVITGAVELAFMRLRPGDEVVLPIAEQLAAVKHLLTCYADFCPVDPATQKQIIRLRTLGTSLLRRTLQRSDYSAKYSVEIGSVVVLVGRLVDLAATLTQLRFELSVSDQRRFRNLASTVAIIRDDLLNRRIPTPVQFNDD